jgi:hypothetical protein
MVTLLLLQLLLDPSKPTTPNPVQATLTLGLSSRTLLSNGGTPVGPTNSYINAAGDSYVNAAGDSYIQP